ncbi:dihydroorotate dehydrogenase electron transfer subunit [Elusimicrobium simillimum]|uniref:dihydroorotate dehydrogenase electron transfer subunit n=1 Tax=Elusimicrobium simillimum TaxID=3143438 RepID=UPI003C6EE847
MNNFDAEVISNTEVAKDIFNLKFMCADLAAAARPGQFVEVLCEGAGAPFLRRPFGVYRAGAGGDCEILFKRVGKGTDILSGLTKGQKINVTGPLGNGFTIEKGKTHLIAGGGMGVAPLMFLAETIFNAGEKPQIFLAAKTAEQIAGIELFKKFGEVIISTEDGSLGEKCLIDTPLERTLKTAKNAVIYSCGPHGMLRCVADLGAKYNTPVQVSLEEKMACGLGVCQGCPVKLKNKDTKYKMVCKDGPVFDGGDVVW